MNLSTTTKPLDELGDRNAPIGSRPWLLYVANEIRKTLYDKEQTGRRLESLIDAFKQHAGWQEFGYLTWEDFCEQRLHTEAEQIETEVMRRAEQIKPLNPDGKHTSLDNCQGITAEQMGAGNSADYLTARIARDRPDILEAMKQGKYRSVRQAAIEAGIVQARQRYSLPDDPIAAGKYLAQRVDKEWLLAMVDEYMKAIEA
jgi:hypothetical protein